MSDQSNPTILGRSTGHLGYGLMGLTWTHDQPDKPFETSIEVMKRALELGADNWNGGEFYGTVERNSMHLLREYFTKYPDDASKVIITIKGGAEKGNLKPNGSEENVSRSVEDCLAVIQGTSKTVIDIFECARVDKNTGVESQMRTLAKYVKAGKIRGIGLSEVSSKTIRTAHKYVVEETGLKDGIASVEVEISLWAPDTINNGILATCAELDLPIFAYSPLARGALSDKPIRRNADLPEGDFRKHLPKFQDDVLEVNNQITDAVVEIAKQHGSTVPQIAIAWVRGQSGRTRKVTLEDGTTKEVKLGSIIPIPGASSVSRVEENLKDVVLTEEELKTLDDLVEKFPTTGDRYPEAAMATING